MLIIVRSIQFIPHDDAAGWRQEGGVQSAMEHQAACKRESGARYAAAYNAGRTSSLLAVILCFDRAINGSLYTVTAKSPVSSSSDVTSILMVVCMGNMWAAGALSREE